jgi:ribose transport system substrate-binding protein
VTVAVDAGTAGFIAGRASWGAAGPDQIKQLTAGDVQALVAQKPYDIGKQGVEQALAALSGSTVTPNVQTESLIVTKDNMSQPGVSKYIYKANC